MTNEKEVPVDMTEYTESLPVVEQCLGCNKVFDFVTADAAPEKRCRAYYNPAAKWPREGQEFAMHTVMVKTREGLKPKEVPVLPKYCGLASHYTTIEIVNTSDKIRSGQQKQK